MVWGRKGAGGRKTRSGAPARLKGLLWLHLLALTTTDQADSSTKTVWRIRSAGDDPMSSGALLCRLLPRRRGSGTALDPLLLVRSIEEA